MTQPAGGVALLIAAGVGGQGALPLGRVRSCSQVSRISRAAFASMSSRRMRRSRAPERRASRRSAWAADEVRRSSTRSTGSWYRFDSSAANCAAGGRQGGLGTVHIIGQSDHRPVGRPLPDAARHRLPVGRAARRQHADGRRGARAGVADRDADAAFPEIEGEYQLRRAGSRARQARPASKLRCSRFTPSSRPASCQRSSSGVVNIRRSSAWTDSQAFWAISSSSWPASQPA